MKSLGWYIVPYFDLIIVRSHQPAYSRGGVGISVNARI